MIIQSHFKQYQVHFKDDFEFVFGLRKDELAYWIVDRNIYDLYGRQLGLINLDKKYLIDAIEEEKTMDTVLDICEAMTELSAKRNIHLISIGGGITQDITGLVANLLYRGIRWTFIPTTLLAACDSCIGGKTSLNYKEYKNLLGTFYPPDDIFICPSFFHTLTERDFQSGLGEVVKFNIMYGKEGIDRIERDITDLLNRKEDTINQYVRQSLEFKKQYIEKDEFDRGIRIYLNFAHTFGHAIEKVSCYEIPHGTAVAMGTVVANDISYQRGYLSKKIVTRVQQIMQKIVHVSFDFSAISSKEIIGAIRKDKKQTGDFLRGVLFTENLELKVFDDLLENEIIQAFVRLNHFLREGAETL